MTQSASKWYSSGYDLWVVPYKSEWYSQMDWWCQFFLSRNLDEKQFNNGQTYIVDVRRFLPNKKLWIYPPTLDTKDLLISSETLAQNLGLGSVRVFCLSPCDPPDETKTGLKWSVVTSEKQMVN